MTPRRREQDGWPRTGWWWPVIVSLALLGLSEVAHWWASRQDLGLRPEAPNLKLNRRGPEAPDRTEVVLVLGYPSGRDGRPSLLQRWRAEIAVRSVAASALEPRVVFSGADPHRGRSEADVMASYARDVLGLPAESILLGERARSTWENVALSLVHLEHADVIKIASDPLHARKARRYLWAQRPDLAARLVRAEDYRPFERGWLRFPLVVHALGSGLTRGARLKYRAQPARDQTRSRARPGRVSSIRHGGGEVG